MEKRKIFRIIIAGILKPRNFKRNHGLNGLNRLLKRMLIPANLRNPWLPILLFLVGMVIFAFKERALSEMALLKGMVIILQLPKRRHSKSRRDKRRAQWKMKSPNLSRCPQCGAPKLPHRVCPECGYYEGREIIPQKKEKKK
jgi:large subunit ribosomal protein L32